MTLNRINFNKIIDALLDDDAEFPISYMMSLSDILLPDLEKLRKSWNLISPARKIALMENIEVAHEAEITSNFEEIAILALDDGNATVRTSGVRLLSDYEFVRNQQLP